MFGGGPKTELVTLLTSLFIHINFLHLGANGLFLWIVGRPVESVIGSRRFLLAYLVSGVVGSLAHWLSDTGSLAPVIGASGAISGIFALYLMLFSNTVVADKIIFGRVVSGRWLRTLWFLAMWLGIQLLTGLVMNNSDMATGIAVWAHIGGFIAGLMCARFMVPQHSVIV